MVLSLLLAAILLGVTHLLYHDCCDDHHATTNEPVEHTCAACHVCHPKVEVKRPQIVIFDAQCIVERKDIVDVTSFPEVYIEGPTEPPRFLLS